MSALALQKAMRGRLTAFPAVTALVHPKDIVDRHGAPVTFPCIMLGEDQEVDAEVTLARRHVRIFATLHVWDRSTSTVGVKRIAGAVRDALHDAPLELNEGRLVDLRHTATRYLRDPDGETAHAVVTVEALIEEAIRQPNEPMLKAIGTIRALVARGNEYAEEAIFDATDTLAELLAELEAGTRPYPDPAVAAAVAALEALLEDADHD